MALGIMGGGGSANAVKYDAKARVIKVGSESGDNEHEVELTARHRVGHLGQLGPAQRPIAVHEADDVTCGGHQPGETGRTEPSPGLAYDLGAAIGRDPP